MPRPRRTQRFVRVHITLSEQVYTTLLMLIYDPHYALGRAPGAFSALCERALREWLDAQKDRTKP